MNQSEKDEILQKLYYDPEHGLINASKLHQKVKELGIKLKEVQGYIQTQKNRTSLPRSNFENLLPHHSTTRIVSSRPNLLPQNEKTK